MESVTQLSNVSTSLIEPTPAAPIAPVAAEPASATRSASIDKLAHALAAAQGAISGANKSAVNSHLKAAYSTLADIVEAYRAALSIAEIAVVAQPAWTPPTNPNSREGLLTLTTTLVHASGQYMSSSLSMPAAGDAKTMASALTTLRKMSLASIIGVCPDDEHDAPKTGFTR